MPTLAQNDTDCPRWSHHEGWCEGFAHDCDPDTIGYREPSCDRATCKGECVMVDLEQRLRIAVEEVSELKPSKHTADVLVRLTQRLAALPASASDQPSGAPDG